MKCKAELFIAGSRTFTSDRGRIYQGGRAVTDGRVLTAGDREARWVLDYASLYGPAAGLWAATGHMYFNRIGHALTLLPVRRCRVSGAIGGFIGRRRAASLCGCLRSGYGTLGAGCRAGWTRAAVPHGQPCCPTAACWSPGEQQHGRGVRSFHTPVELPATHAHPARSGPHSSIVARWPRCWWPEDDDWPVRLSEEVVFRHSPAQVWRPVPAKPRRNGPHRALCLPAGEASSRAERRRRGRRGPFGLVTEMRSQKLQQQLVIRRRLKSNVRV